MNGKKPNDTDYLYATARIRAVEASGSLREKNEKMLNAANFAEAVSIFFDSNGIENINSGNFELALEKELVKNYDFVTSLAGENTIVNIFKYPYDCNNLKVALKCEIAGIDPEKLFFSFATVTVPSIFIAMRDRDFSIFPPHMKSAAMEITELISKNPDPQNIDIILDRACLEDMVSAAESFGCDYLSDIIKTKTDSYNILSFIRCTRMKKHSAFYRKLVVNGGFINVQMLIDSYDGGLSSLASELKFTSYANISEKILKYLSDATEGFFSLVERELESFYNSRVDEVKFISFGPEILIGFLITCEKEIKNARIILSGKSANLQTERIKERLRV